MNGVRLGVLSVQGDVDENLTVLSSALKIPQGRDDDSILPVRTPEAVSRLDGLVIPGGESTAIGTMSLANGTLDAVRSRIVQGMPVLGICAGMILLSGSADDRVMGSTGQPLLNVLDVRLERNSFGRQRQSFEAKISMRPIAIIDFRGVFIRAPSILEVGPGVEILSKLDGDGRIIAVRKDNIIGTVFHPELAGDVSVHKYFVDTVRRTKQ